MHRFMKIRIIRDFEYLEEQGRRSFDTLLEAYKTSVSFRPAADFYETVQGLVLRLELAGVAAEDVSLTLTGHELVVRGRRRPPRLKTSGASSTWRWPTAFLNGASGCPYPLIPREWRPAMPMAYWKSICPARRPKPEPYR